MAHAQRYSLCYRSPSHRRVFVISSFLAMLFRCASQSTKNTHGSRFRSQLQTMMPAVSLLPRLKTTRTRARNKMKSFRARRLATETGSTPTRAYSRTNKTTNQRDRLMHRNVPFALRLLWTSAGTVFDPARNQNACDTTSVRDV